MTEASAVAEYRALVSALEPAARVVPARALRRAIRLGRDRGTFRPRAVHGGSWWVRRDDLFRLLTPAELNLSENEPPELLLLPAPEAGVPAPTPEAAWRTLFHAGIDRELERAGPDESAVRHLRRTIGPDRWHTIRTVLTEENLIGEADADRVAMREFGAFALELTRFRPDDWDAYFPGLSPDGEPLRTVAAAIDVDALCERTRPAGAAAHPESLPTPSPPAPAVAARPPEDAAVGDWIARGNDLKASVQLTRAGDPSGRRHLDHLVDRLADVLGLDSGARHQWHDAVRPLLQPASGGGWPVERRLLYELQRACLAVERTNYSINLFDWLRTVGRRPLRRPLPKARWPEANRRLRAAQFYADRLPPGDDHESPLIRLLADAAHVTEARARDDLRPDIVAVLDEVGLVPASAPEERSREKLVEELLDIACARGFMRIGDLRDAIARNRVKLPDLRGPSDLVRGDPLIRANELLSVRLDGVYRRGEVYMRLLQRGCSVFFGTPVGRWFSKYVALPFGGAFILLEAVGHLYDAAEGVVNWLSGRTAAVDGVGLLGGGMAGTLADNPTLDPGGVSWEAVLAVGVFLLFLLHWPAFRTRVGRAARFVFIKVPRAILRSPLVYRLVHNPATRFIRRYLLLPVVAGGTSALAARLAGGDAASVALVGAGMAMLAGTFFRTPFGREVEDRIDEAMERVWRVVSVNFVIGLLTLVLHFFRAVFEAIDRAIHAVDEGLRFREGQGRTAFAAKLVVGTGWAAFAYLFRFAWTLLVEPQINPIKHFPVVTVSHKILLPLIPPLAKQFGVAKETMATIVFGIPGIFGFLVWELKENWKLYRANALKDIRPIQVGSHGETVRGLLRPGFHSGTLPKAFAKLRRAVRAGNASRAARQRHAIEHVVEAVERFAERTFLAYLRSSRRWAGEAVSLVHPVVGPNRIALPVRIGGRPDPVQIALEEGHGWIIGSVPDAGALADVRSEQRAAFADALVGFYKRAGVDALREQVAAMFGDQAYGFEAGPEGLVIPLGDGKDRLFDYEDGPDIEPSDRGLPTRAIVLTGCPLPWSDWAARWEADAGGKASSEPIIPGWTVLPAGPAGGATGSRTR